MTRGNFLRATDTKQLQFEFASGKRERVADGNLLMNVKTVRPEYSKGFLRLFCTEFSY